jgi:hypothetical protein
LKSADLNRLGNTRDKTLDIGDKSRKIESSIVGNFCIYIYIFEVANTIEIHTHNCEVLNSNPSEEIQSSNFYVI